MKSSSGRDEWLRLMVEIAATDRDLYRKLRQEAWDRVERGHAEKTAEERAVWQRNAS